MGYAIQTGDDVICREWVAVVKLHTPTQFETPHSWRYVLPAFSQGGLDLQVAGVTDQTFVDVVQNRQGERLAERVGIQRRNFPLRPPFQGLTLRLCATNGRHEGCSHGCSK